jgi:chromosome segregation ATPase
MTTTTKPTPSKPQAVVPEAHGESLLNLTTPVAEAEAVIAKLEGQRDKLAARQAEHDAECQRLAFAARAQGDAEASKRLSVMADEAIRSEHAARDIDAALKTARARLEQAQRTAASAEDRCAAHKVRKLGNSIAERLAHVDALYEVAAAELNAASDEQAAINALGEAYPSSAQFRLNMIPALQAMIMSLPQSWWRDWSRFRPFGWVSCRA